jgi:hypothetical protein
MLGPPVLSKKTIVQKDGRAIARQLIELVELAAWSMRDKLVQK